MKKINFSLITLATGFALAGALKESEIQKSSLFQHYKADHRDCVDGGDDYDKSSCSDQTSTVSDMKSYYSGVCQNFRGKLDRAQRTSKISNWEG